MSADDGAPACKSGSGPGLDPFLLLMMLAEERLK
jgi:hypothetical protein